MATMEERKLKVAEAKLSQCFLRIQTIYDLIPHLEDEKVFKQFMSKASMVDQLRKEFSELMDDINLLHLEIKPDYAVNYKSMNAFDDLYCVIKCALSKFDVTSSRAMAAVRDSSHTCKDELVKIPRIELPTFDGEIQNFPFFYETFKRVIHENYKLTDSERVHYLFSHLTGKAKSICAGIIPAAENYKMVWDALIAKYHDKRALATSYLNQLFAMKPVNGPSASNLENMIDKFAATVSAIKQLKINNMSEFIFIHLGLKLLDPDTAKSFEMSIRDSIEMPNYEEFINFVRGQAKILHRTSQRPPTKADNTHVSSGTMLRAPLPRTPHAYVSTQAHDSNSSCVMCSSNEHAQLYNCNSFLRLTPKDRYNYIRETRSCTNCLNTRHTSSKCFSKKTCRKCNGKHHSLLHFNSAVPNNDEPCTSQTPNAVMDKFISNEVSKPSTSTNVYTSAADNIKDSSVCTLSASGRSKSNATEVLATAKVLAVGHNGNDRLLRCLLDPGSQKHYITTKCCKALGLAINPSSLTSVKGIGGASQPVRGIVKLTFSSRFDSDNLYNIEALVLDEITSYLPTCQIDLSSMTNVFDNIPLADDTWAIPGEVDLLIGVMLFAKMLMRGKVLSDPGLPDAIETALGYIILGNAPTKMVSRSAVGYCSTVDLDHLIKRFWEVEDLGEVTVHSAEDKKAEEIYTTTVKRLEDGRYQLALPFKLNPDNLGDSYKTAERRYKTLERKFIIQPNLKPLYDAVILEHIEKGYLSEVKEPGNENAYYIPHHAVCREDRITTKVRVVLDASAKTSSGFSLNDVLHAGPSLQADLFCILLNLRLFAVAITADVRQMYLCIDVRNEDRPYQRILYRFNPNEPVKVYQYNRVAFGLRSSPFLALRTVQQLVADEGDRFPIAKEIASRDIYMDDVASSIVDETLGVQAAKQLLEMFLTAGFQLAKWSSNSTSVLDQIPKELRLSQSVSFDDDATLKILGLQWYPADDVFKFQVNPDERPCTKRNILSSVARLFDVLGLVAPVVVFAKLLIKELWLAKIDWDELAPDHISRQWNQFRQELPLLSKISFPRHIGVKHKCSLTILGFADASERAYGGMVYAYVKQPSNDHGINLICAKSKVAPLKVVTLARLELCAALLLSQLIKKVMENYSPRYPIDSVLAFSDSTVALSWIHSSPHRWQTFVANRVAKIQENIPSNNFFYIKGTDNPSDCLSRGLTPAQLVNHPLWLHGPPWIKLPRDEWPVKKFVPDGSEIDEAKTVTLVTTEQSNEDIIYDLSKRFSSWNKYIRAVVYIYKFIKKLPRGPITADDLATAELEVVRALQNVYFGQYIVNNMITNKGLPTAFSKLKPFLDNGILRVGGRLSNSSEDYDYKHPVLLPRRDHIINLIVDYNHHRHFHAGPETLMSILRHRYWIIAARCIIRHRIHLCNSCFRTKPKSVHPIMGDLPSFRVNKVDKAFIHTGCDYAGPLYCTPVRRRGVKSQKVYLCLFTCLTTRAIHLELASDLSTASFMNAFKRFLSRRGPVNYMYSDNGTNFVGAKSYLRELHDFLNEKYRQFWMNELAENRITWKFIPPNAPHFGGCWESNVKCVKTHLFRTIGNQILSYEELTTILTQIEALLNSRPLTVLSADPAELTALTPAHFLNVAPLKFLPAAPVVETSDHLLHRYQLLDRMTQSFWKRWREEYLHTLQSRQKWNVPSQPVKAGTVVVIMQDNVMPLQWQLGLITELIVGKDGVARVAGKDKDRHF